MLSATNQSVMVWTRGLCGSGLWVVSGFCMKLTNGSVMAASMLLKPEMFLHFSSSRFLHTLETRLKDWTGLGSSGLYWTGLYWPPGLDWTSWTQQIGLGWVVLGCTGTGGTGLDARTGLD